MRTSRPSEPAAEARRPFAALAVAAAIGILALALYRATLLPDVDFGDSGSFQTTVGTPYLTPRVGYPLYFAIGGAFLRATGFEPAFALNLVTAIEAAIACALLVLVAAEFAESLAVAAAAALLFAASYTFWSQAVTAEVYALHLVCVLASLWFLLRWERDPTPARLAAFFLTYAIGFGNHLSMILLAPAFTLFLLLSAPGGWRTLVTPRVVALAAACALAGASQYLWNIRTLWFQLDPPRTIGDALAIFWFDVTKSDWRDTMVLEVPRSLVRDHFAMYWFDLRQQFGIAGPALAAIGALALTRRHWRRAVLLLLMYLSGFAFAFSYNVGDAHVFYLPTHLVVALLAACGIAAIGRIHPRAMTAAAFLVAVYAGARAYIDFPALDRSRDTRARLILQSLTNGLDDRHAIFLVDLNWQVANGLSYFTKSVRPDVVTARIRDVLLYAPALIADNLAGGRGVALTAEANRILSESYGPLFSAAVDVAPPSFEEVARAAAPGTRYVVCLLTPSRDLAVDTESLRRALAILSGRAGVIPQGEYAVVAGVVGAAPAVVFASDRPFSRTVGIDGATAVVRMESWLMSDTIRRMGFGHVIVNRRHTLIVERGISFATFDAAGDPIATAYFSSIFAMPGRYFIR